MRPRSDPAGLVDPANDVLNLSFTPLDIAGRALIQVTVKGLADICDVALLHQEAGEMRPAGLRIAKSLRILAPDLKTQLAQPRRQPLVALAAGRLETFQKPPQILAGRHAEKIAQDVDRLPVESCAELDPANQLEARRPRMWRRLIVAFECVMVGDSQRPEAFAATERDQLRWRQASIGLVGVGVKV